MKRNVNTERLGYAMLMMVHSDSDLLKVPGTNSSIHWGRSGTIRVLTSKAPKLVATGSK